MGQNLPKWGQASQRRGQQVRRRRSGKSMALLVGLLWAGGCGYTTPDVPDTPIDHPRPDVFSLVDTGMWDGRPSLGGVWIAHPDVSAPERVQVRNAETQKTVVAALYGRDADLQKPLLMVSSDAAVALGMTAGAEATLDVVALRPAPAEQVQARQKMDHGPEKPFIQVGIFNIRSNATRTAQTLRDAGLVPNVIRQNPRGTPFWRVTVGPAATQEARALLLTLIRDAGFDDAYPVTH